MLTQEERVKSLVHKRLRRLKGFSPISEVDIAIPEVLDDKDILGVYTNTDSTHIFITVDGVYTDKTATYVYFSNVIKVTINREGKEKKDVNTITIHMNNDKTALLEILQPQSFEEGIQEAWSIYSFLLQAVK